MRVDSFDPFVAEKDPFRAALDAGQVISLVERRT